MRPPSWRNPSALAAATAGGLGIFSSGQGSGSLGGAGKAVTIANSGVITTSGIGSSGIKVQSIGDSSGMVALGGYGGQAANGGIVTITNTSGGTIRTGIGTTAAGDAATGCAFGCSYGILGQSLGGGGGNPASSVGWFSVGSKAAGGDRSGYHRRSRVETRMHCLKLLGQRLMGRDFDRQVAAVQARVAILNGCTALGCWLSQKPWDKSVREKGKNRPSAHLRERVSCHASPCPPKNDQSRSGIAANGRNDPAQAHG